MVYGVTRLLYHAVHHTALGGVWCMVLPGYCIMLYTIQHQVLCGVQHQSTDFIYSNAVWCPHYLLIRTVWCCIVLHGAVWCMVLCGINVPPFVLSASDRHNVFHPSPGDTAWCCMVYGAVYGAVCCQLLNVIIVFHPSPGMVLYCTVWCCIVLYGAVWYMVLCAPWCYVVSVYHPLFWSASDRHNRLPPFSR